jgi:excisionase family DNA binding protein
MKPTPSPILDLADAARIINVHPSTLRRWADAGKVPHTRTLSGRRRFLRADLEQTLREMGHAPAVVESGQQQVEAKSITMTRQRASDLSESPTQWSTKISEEQRMLFRYSGKHLLGLMMQFVSRSDAAETFLEDGRRVAADYGHICYKAGLTIDQTAEAFIYFRRSILQSVQAAAPLSGQQDPDGQRIFLRTMDFFDSLLVATIESYSRIEHAERNSA